MADWDFYLYEKDKFTNRLKQSSSRGRFGSDRSNCLLLKKITL